ncbi:hypothetical protein CTZ27_03835 [Streptomyces griseocarneus]|nr:hypothetical protein CTZ27_03835 [Streptomyces griseocarneus]
MAERGKHALALAVAAVSAVLACSSSSVAATPPLVNAQCVGQGAVVALLEHGTEHDERYTCHSTEGAVLLDLSKAFQGASATVSGSGQRLNQVFE